MIEVEAPDGSLVEFPEGTNESTILSVMQENYRGTTPLEAGGYGDPVMSMVGGVADMASFGFADEAIAGINSLARGTEFKDELSHQHGIRQSLQEGQEGVYTAGQVAGAFIPGAAAPSVIKQGIAKLGTAAPIRTALGVGGASGGLYGAGSGAEGNRLEKAAQMGGVGAVGGIAGLGAVKAVGSLAQRAKSLYSKPIQRTAQEVIEAQSTPPPIQDTPKATQKVGRALTQDFGDDLDTVLTAYKNGDMSLADMYGKRTSSLAEAAALFPAGREVAEEAIEKKTVGAYERLIKSVRENISGVDNYYTTAEDLVNAGRSKAAPLYEKAYNFEIKQSPKLNELLSRPAGREALKKADKIAANEGIDISGEKNTMVFDYIKRGFDDVLEKYRDKTTGKLVLDTNGRAINQLRAEYVDELKSLNPFYKQALEESSDYLRVKEVMEQGRKALKTDSEVTAKIFKNLPGNEKQAYKIGLGKAVRDELNKVREGANPFNRLLKSPEQQKRLQAVLSPKEYMGFEKALRAEDRLFKFRNKVLGGSPTAGREELKSLIEAGEIDSITGVPKQTFTMAIKKMYTSLKSGVNDKTAAKISDILYETDPVKKLKIIEGLKKSNLTPKEISTVEEAYSLMAPRYDALYALPAGLTATLTKE